MNIIVFLNIFFVKYEFLFIGFVCLQYLSNSEIGMLCTSAMCLQVCQMLSKYLYIITKFPIFILNNILKPQIMNFIEGYFMIIWHIPQYHAEHACCFGELQ